jgi:hypothetical protein
MQTPLKAFKAAATPQDNVSTVAREAHPNIVLARAGAVKHSPINAAKRTGSWC